MLINPYIFGGYKANAVQFDGTNDYLSRGGVLTGVTNTKEFTLSCWVNLSDLTSNGFIFEGGRGVHFQAFDNGSFSFNGGATDGGNAFFVNNLTTGGVANQWVHVLAAANTATSSVHMYIDDISNVDSSGTADKLIDYTLSSYFVGSNQSSADLFDGAMADLWMDNSYIDITIEANRRLFSDSDGKPVNLGSDGSTPTGSSPLMFFSGATNDWHTNKGTGGGFTENGALTTATTSPSD